MCICCSHLLTVVSVSGLSWRWPLLSRMIDVRAWAEYVVEWAAKDPYGFLTTVILALTPLFIASALLSWKLAKMIEARDREQKRKQKRQENINKAKRKKDWRRRRNGGVAMGVWRNRASSSQPYCQHRAATPHVQEEGRWPLGLDSGQCCPCGTLVSRSPVVLWFTFSTEISGFICAAAKTLHSRLTSLVSWINLIIIMMMMIIGRYLVWVTCYQNSNFLINKMFMVNRIKCL